MKKKKIKKWFICIFNKKVNVFDSDINIFFLFLISSYLGKILIFFTSQIMINAWVLYIIQYNVYLLFNKFKFCSNK